MHHLYGGADKSLALPISRCILFDGENISFDASLVIYINSTDIPQIMIINRIYENQNILSLQLVSFLVGLRNYQHPGTLAPVPVPMHHLYSSSRSCSRAQPVLYSPSYSWIRGAHLQIRLTRSGHRGPVVC
jgi:hypothetical protein